MYFQDVTIECLLEGIKKSSSAKGIIITGYPRNMEQVGDYGKFVSYFVTLHCLYIVFIYIMLIFMSTSLLEYSYKPFNCCYLMVYYMC